MAADYGIRVTGDNNVLQIDANAEMLGMAIRASGYSTSVSPNSYSSRARIFVRPASLPSGGEAFVGWSYNGSNYLFKDRNNNTINAYWVAVDTVNDISPSGSYGFWVSNSNGAIAFDSRRIGASGFRVIASATSGSKSGNPSLGNSLLTSNWSSSYFCIHGSSVQAGGSFVGGQWYRGYSGVADGLHFHSGDGFLGSIPNGPDLLVGEIT